MFDNGRSSSALPLERRPSMAPNQDLLDRVASSLSCPPAYGEATGSTSLLLSAAVGYGTLPQHEDDGAAVFDPEHAARFEAVVEAAFLVAYADGTFDAKEQHAFEHVVVAACAGRVNERQVRALLTDLETSLAEDGFDRRIRMVARHIRDLGQAREVLRVAALIAAVSCGVSAAERQLLAKLAAALDLGTAAVDAAIAEAERALGGSQQDPG